MIDLDAQGNLPVKEPVMDHPRSKLRYRPALYPPFTRYRRYRSRSGPGSTTLSFNSLALCLNMLSILASLAPNQTHTKTNSPFNNYWDHPAHNQSSVSKNLCTNNTSDSNFNYQQRQITSATLNYDLLLNTHCRFISFCPNNLFTCLSSQRQIAATSLIVLQRSSHRPLRHMTPKLEANRPLAITAGNILLFRAGDIQ